MGDSYEKNIGSVSCHSGLYRALRLRNCSKSARADDYRLKNRKSL